MGPAEKGCSWREQEKLPASKTSRQWDSFPSGIIMTPGEDRPRQGEINTRKV